MKRRLRPLLLAAALLAPSASGGAGPARIVSLKPNVTEILFAIGAGDRVVGVTTWCDYPPAAARLPKVADYVAPNVEQVLALHPDLAVGSMENALSQPVRQLESSGVRVALFPFDSLDATWASIRAIGAAVGAPAAADALVHRMREAMRTMRIAWGAAPTPRVLIAVGRRPLVAAGPRSFLGELLRWANGANVVTTTAVAYPRLSRETLLASNPDVLIDLGGGMGEPESDWPGGRVQPLPTALFRPGPRLAEGLRALGGAVHGAGVANRRAP